MKYIKSLIAFILSVGMLSLNAYAFIDESYRLTTTADELISVVDYYKKAL